jgi:hypothetical protein
MCNQPYDKKSASFVFGFPTLAYEYRAHRSNREMYGLKYLRPLKPQGRIFKCYVVLCLGRGLSMG